MASSISESSFQSAIPHRVTNGVYPKLRLTVRFSSAHSDLAIDGIIRPEWTTGLSLLAQIRGHLPDPHARCKILLIAGGRVLPPKESLALSLRLKPGPSPSLAVGYMHPRINPRFNYREAVDRKGKGKEQVLPAESNPWHEDKNNEVKSAGVEATEDGEKTTLRQIIHATFSNPDTGLLSDDDLEKEQLEGEALNTALREQDRLRNQKQRYSSLSNVLNPAQSSSSSTLPQQGQQAHNLGFSRLLSSGISEEEVVALRRDFCAILAAENPDAPPLTPLELLALEERWLDSNDTTSNRAITGVTLTSTSDPTSQSMYTSDILWGNVLGFFWPLGALFVLGRQQGMWRSARGLAVIVGALINVGFCLFRLALVGAGTELDNATASESG